MFASLRWEIIGMPGMPSVCFNIATLPQKYILCRTGHMYMQTRPHVLRIFDDIVLK